MSYFSQSPSMVLNRNEKQYQLVYTVQLLRSGRLDTLMPANVSVLDRLHSPDPS